MLSIDYPLPVYGLGTDFSNFERPLTFAQTYTNRFRNITGGAERRPGMIRYSTVSGGPNLTRLHEHVNDSGGVTLLASDDFGAIWRLNSSGSASVAVGGKAFQRQLSVQAEDKLIFYNGVDRNYYTDDGGVTFNELRALITQGITAAGTNATTLVDNDISNWIGGTLVANNDIVYNVTCGGYGIVSTVASASLTYTKIDTSGNGGNGAGAAVNVKTPTANDVYQLLDYVDLNIFPQTNNISANVILYDNISTAGPGTGVQVIAVSGFDFSTSEIRYGDVVYNTTVGAIAFIGSVSANVNLQQSIAGQASGDALAFFKSAMPIASWIHVHYGRVYYLDARNNRRVVISAPDDPQDVTTFQKTLDTSSFLFGSQQPTGDVIKTMCSFQKYFVASGERNLFIYDGMTPIQDAVATDINFNPIAYYPNGVASRFGLGTNGSDLLHITTEGLQAINIGNISNTTVQNNASVPVRTAFLDAILSTTADNIQLSFYPRRSWLITKVGDVCYVLNTNPTYDDSGQLQAVSSWHLFTGKWAQQNHYFIRKNGDLLACGTGGLIYLMDSSAATDDGTRIQTDLTTAWLTLEEPKRTKRVKQGQYISPIFESTAGIAYTINAVAGWDAFSSDSIIVSAVGAGQIGSAIIGTTPIGAGNFAQASKYPLRWRGEQCRIQFTTESSAFPDIITGFTLHGEVGGIR
jgi:hypothetical protein